MILWSTVSNHVYPHPLHDCIYVYIIVHSPFSPYTSFSKETPFFLPLLNPIFLLREKLSFSSTSPIPHSQFLFQYYISFGPPTYFFFFFFHVCYTFIIILGERDTNIYIYNIYNNAGVFFFFFLYENSIGIQISIGKIVV